VRNRLINTEGKQPEYYKGMLIHADTGMHDQAADLFKKYVRTPATVVDVGAGAGAFSQRLHDLGYSVTALDVDPDKWAANDIAFQKLNIDLGIAGSLNRLFDAACCLEVIEHVENPWNLLREIHSILKPGGVLILSTPNITSFLSRILFLRNGTFHQFEEGDLSYGHINPISAFELQHAAVQTGWVVKEVREGGYLPVFDTKSFGSWFRTLSFNVLCGLSYLFARGNKNGWCLFFVLQKPATN